MVQGTNVFVSSMSITAIALDRCRLIMNPSRQDIRDKTVHTIIALLWILAFLLSTPLGVFATLSVNGSLDICSEVTLDYNLRITKVVYSVLMMLLLYGTPVALVSIAYAQICVMVHQRIKKKQQPQFKFSTDGNISSNPNYGISGCFESNRHFSVASTTEPLTDLRPSNIALRLSRRKSDGGTMYTYLQKPSHKMTDSSSAKVTIRPPNWLPINIVNLLLDLRELKFEVVSINDTEIGPTEIDWTPLNTSSNVLNPHLQRTTKEDKGTLSGELVIITQAVCLLCVLLSACVNPMLYGWLNENFQRHFKKILRCRPTAQTNITGDISRRRAQWPKHSKQKLKDTKTSVNISAPNIEMNSLSPEPHSQRTASLLSDKKYIGNHGDNGNAMQSTSQPMHLGVERATVLQETDIDAL
ncbi:pancreatic polypeptide receptor activity [Sparganum proliferum]